jgi:hypothetical protein
MSAEDWLAEDLEPDAYRYRMLPWPGDQSLKSMISSRKPYPIKRKEPMQNLDYQEHISGRKEFYILWNPDSEKPPRITFSTEEHAFQVAEEMARRGDGQRFFVMKAVGSSMVEKPVVTKKFIQEIGEVK